ncbi:MULTISPECIES: hypothetical protein [Bacillaceae]|uniref:Uncharacterized protein n=1 Tax=Evansella alkalicola TaxID=745819 RepID=A0ABS6JZ44_9BACI|nr:MULTISPECIES: hypothetical protein [Bacillaceae]MBU9723851.1 hypothetical protein [Bacillus alkalicola]
MTRKIHCMIGACHDEEVPSCLYILTFNAKEITLNAWSLVMTRKIHCMIGAWSCQGKYTTYPALVYSKEVPAYLVTVHYTVPGAGTLFKNVCSL